jgi:hypothetical protein
MLGLSLVLLATVIVRSQMDPRTVALDARLADVIASS